MHKELRAFFDEHKRPTHMAVEDVGTQQAPLVAVMGQARVQMVHYENLLAQAEMAPHDARLDGKLEMMHQTIRHAKAQMDAMTQLAREVRRDFAQLARYATEWEEEIAAFENANQSPTGDVGDGANSG